MKKSLLGCLLVAAVVSAPVMLPAANQAEAASAVTQTSATSQIGTIQASVRLRDKPSTSSQVICYLKSGEKVTILEKSTAYFYKVKTSAGKVGYTSTASQYIKVTSVTSGSSNGSTAGSGSNSGSNSNSNSNSNSGSGSASLKPPTSNVSATIEKVIQSGMKYLGTPYEFGADRNQTKTFDCSAFTRQIFKEGSGIVLPMDSRQQGTWVKQNSKAVSNTASLKRGDLVFFMSYKGSSASAYAGINKDQERITHVAVYLGDGKLLHTYSNEAGGVVVTDFSNSWKMRFLYGGSVIK
ncbi:MAG: C40 family peptidase [Paenibacillus sp.]|nr:C40 family peptidase [Paenibacillus sp.]